MKQPPCCARLAGRIRAEEAHLATLARRAAHPRNRSVTREDIAKQKADVAFAKQNLIDHEAQHAEEDAA